MAARLGLAAAAGAACLAACAAGPQQPKVSAPVRPPTIAEAEQPGSPPVVPPPPAAAAEAPAETAPAEALEALAAAEQEARNTAVVIAFYELVFQDHRVEEAFDRYGGEGYIQHSPGVPNGRAAVEASLIPYFRNNPLASSEIKRVIAQGDLVVLHVHAKSDPVDRGRAVVEIFRVRNGRIVEHWDVIQPIPASAANENTMF